MSRARPLVLAAALLAAAGCETADPQPAASTTAFACASACGKASGQPGDCCGKPRREVRYLCPECLKGATEPATCCGVAMPAAAICPACGKAKPSGATCCGAVLR